MDALRQCNKEAEPFKDYTWGEEQSARYRACAGASTASRNNGACRANGGSWSSASVSLLLTDAGRGFAAYDEIDGDMDRGVHRRGFGDRACCGRKPAQQAPQDDSAKSELKLRPNLRSGLSRPHRGQPRRRRSSSMACLAWCDSRCNPPATNARSRRAAASSSRPARCASSISTATAATTIIVNSPRRQMRRLRVDLLRHRRLPISKSSCRAGAAASAACSANTCAIIEFCRARARAPSASRCTGASAAASAPTSATSCARSAHRAFKFR